MTLKKNDQVIITQLRWVIGQSWVQTVIGVILLIALWHYSIVTGVVKSLFLPPPMEVVLEFARLWDLILTHLGTTLFEAAVGFIAAVILSLGLGLVITSNEMIYNTLMPLIVGSNSVPRIALAPLFIFYFGSGEVAKFVIAAWLAFFPMLINTVDGLSLRDDDREMMLELYNATIWQEIRLVRIPNALPHIFDGMKLAANLAIVGAIVGEFVAANRGLGFLTLWALENFQIATALSIVLIMGIVGVATLIGLYVLQNKLVFWREATMFGGGR